MCISYNLYYTCKVILYSISTIDCVISRFRKSSKNKNRRVTSRREPSDDKIRRLENLFKCMAQCRDTYLQRIMHIK